jgi:GNAT superfamily N-acetyltransferase
MAADVEADMQITLLTQDLIPSAQHLVNAVFPQQSLSERLSFWSYRHRDSLPMKLLFRLAGIDELLGYWVAVSEEQHEVLAITGLYSYVNDAEEAVWLGWFCVAPSARHMGLGGRMLDFAIEKARTTGKRCFRLYTSTSPNEAAAQQLYERKGFRLVNSEPGTATTLLYREKLL